MARLGISLEMVTGTLPRDLGHAVARRPARSDRRVRAHPRPVRRAARAAHRVRRRRHRGRHHPGPAADELPDATCWPASSPTPCRRSTTSSATRSASCRTCSQAVKLGFPGFLDHILSLPARRVSPPGCSAASASSASPSPATSPSSRSSTSSSRCSGLTVEHAVEEARPAHRPRAGGHDPRRDRPADRRLGVHQGRPGDGLAADLALRRPTSSAGLWDTLLEHGARSGS